jgi:hypothetical protein
VVKAVATTLLQRFRCELRPGSGLHVSKLPTLSPEGGMPMLIRPRRPAAAEDSPTAPAAASGAG